MCQDRVDRVQRGGLRGCLFSVAVVSERVGAQQRMLYLQLLRARGPYRRLRSESISV